MSKTYRREKQHRKERTKILIVCEGEKTEPNYFKEFPVDKEIVNVDIKGDGKNTISLVKEAIDKKKKKEFEREPYNQVWCVFDKDDFSNSDFNNAIKIAKKEKINVAYSNEAFELWYYLHFNYTDSALHRRRYKSLLTRELKEKYQKNSPNMYKILRQHQDKAIKNAEELLIFQNCNQKSPANSNPSTTVHNLIKQLNKFI